MEGVNKAFLIGTVGADPEVKVISEDRTVVKFSLATNRSYKNKSTGEKTTEVMWHKVEAWGSIAESIGKWVKKGQHLFVEGEIRYSNYEKDGVKHYVTTIMAKGFQMMGGPKGDSNTEAAAAESVQQFKTPPAQASAPASAPQTVSATSADVVGRGQEDDDLPF